MFIENVVTAFDEPATIGSNRRMPRPEDHNAQLEAKMAKKEEVIAEIMASHV